MTTSNENADTNDNNSGTEEQGAGDIDLDEVLNLESTFQAEGFRDSQQSSARAGHSDGRDLGWMSGSTLASELSFYRGSAHAMLSLSTTYPGKFSERAISTARLLKQEADAMLLHETGNDPNIDMEQQPERIRTLFKTCMAQASLIVRYDKRPSKLNDLSF